MGLLDILGISGLTQPGGLFGSDAPAPQPEVPAQNVAAPVVAPPASSGFLAEKMANPLFQAGLAGLISGGDPRQQAVLMQGMAQAQAQKRKEAEKQQLQQAAFTALRGMGMDEAQAKALAANPDTAYSIVGNVMQQKLMPKEPKYTSTADGIVKIDPATGKAELVYKAKEDDIKYVGDKDTGWFAIKKDGTTKQIIPGRFSGAGAGGPIPPGVDPETYLKEQAKATVEQQQSMKDAERNAEIAAPILDRAERAYKNLAANKGIGPIAAMGVNRTIMGSLGAQNEIWRQEYEAAAKELELMKAQIMMKGQGTITESERKLLQMTLPRLDAADPSVGIGTFKSLRQQFNQRAGRPAGDGKSTDPNHDPLGIR